MEEKSFGLLNTKNHHLSSLRLKDWWALRDCFEEVLLCLYSVNICCGPQLEPGY